MKKVIAASLVALFLSSVPVHPQDWTSVAAKVAKALVALEDEQGRNFCTGFVIDSQKNFIQTADHCLNGTVYVDGQVAVVMSRDDVNDLAVLKVEKDNRPALKPSARSLKRGMPVMTVGHAYGFEELSVRPGYISSLNNTLRGFGVGYVAVVPSLVGGQSGGPIVDVDGNVVAINQVGDNYTGWGQPIGKILASMGKYWRR